jgi:hypothetical protein
MYYVSSLPWPIKMLVFGMGLMRSFAAPDPLGALSLSVFQTCFWSVCVCTVGALLPSLLYSVRSRRETTNFISQTMLMGTFAAVSMCTLFRHSVESRSHTCMAMLVLSTHFLYMLCRAVSVAPRLLNYGQGVQMLSALACATVAGVLSQRLPAQPVHGLHTVALLFAGEVLGLLTFVVSETMRACADGVEHFCAAPNL